MKKLFNLVLIFSSVLTLTAQNDLKNWQHSSKSENTNGINTNEAYKKLFSKKSKTVVVAVIDSGVEVDHEDLDEVIWINTDEIPNNGIDDDDNGYIDDIHGWNFLGNPSGANIGSETYEVTRLYAKLHKKYKDVESTSIKKKKNKKEFALYEEVRSKVESERKKAEEKIAESSQPNTELDQLLVALSNLEKLLAEQNIDQSNFDSLDLSNSPELQETKNIVSSIFSQLGSAIPMADLKQLLKENLGTNSNIEKYQNKLAYAYNPDFNSREIIGDDYDNPYEKGYGNNDYEGPDAFHGTHVAGIIAAERNNGLGMDGIADDVRIMTLRAVPDGDEHDKDVANAIIYAVDNGAKIINMSFGKGYSWDKKVVDKAVKYALKHDVLLVHAAGNSNQENTSYNNFPNDRMEKRGLFGPKEAKNWIEVGALSPTRGTNSPARFSNYSYEQVDIFAPGVSIYSTIPDNEYSQASGTSMASPVVAGTAALLKSYFPSLTAVQIKDIIMKSSSQSEVKVLKPGTTEELVSMNILSRSGGILNAAAAVDLALSTTGKAKIL